MTPRQRHILRLVRDRIKRKKNLYICLTISDIDTEYYPLYEKDCEYLKKYIREKLTGYACLEYWQKSRGIPRGDDRHSARVAWLNWILEEGEFAKAA